VCRVGIEKTFSRNDLALSILFTPETRRKWGAQAASLLFAAACREHLHVLAPRSQTDAFGKLPNAAGSQPAVSSHF